MTDSSVRMQIRINGAEETIPLAHVEMTPEFTDLVTRQAEAGCAALGRPFSWRLGWAVNFFMERDLDARRRLLAALKSREPGISGVEFREQKGEVLVAFRRFSGSIPGERFMVPEIKTTIPEPPPAPVVVAPPPTVSSPVREDAPKRPRGRPRKDTVAVEPARKPQPAAKAEVDLTPDGFVKWWK